MSPGKLVAPALLLTCAALTVAAAARWCGEAFPPPAERAASRPSSVSPAAMMTIPVEIIEPGRAPRRSEVQVRLED